MQQKIYPVKMVELNCYETHKNTSKVSVSVSYKYYDFIIIDSVIKI